MEYKYSKYPVNVEQLSDEILSSLNLIVSKINTHDVTNGDISYSDADFVNNLNIILDDTLNNDNEIILNNLVANHNANSNYKPIDWARRRDVILPQFFQEAGNQLQNFASLSNKTKLIACDFFLIPYNIRTQIISNEQDSKNWEFLLRKTKESRIDCIEAMRIKTGEYIRIGLLSLEQTQFFYKDVFNYINFFIDTNSPEFKQWLISEVGTQFENNGFSEKSYYLEQLKTELVDIYNGNY